MKERLMDLKLRDEQISISSASSVWLSSRAVSKQSSQVSQPVQGSRREASRLVAKFGELYSQARLDTLDALDEIKELADADELKNKLLFSVVVLSFRLVIRSLSVVKQQVSTVLQIPPSSALGPEEAAMSHVGDFQTALDSYLRKCTNTFNL